jgi:hypothetical protein
MTKEFRHLLGDARRTHANFLITDIETALTFLDVAETTRAKQTANRNRRNARKAHDVVVRYLAKHDLDPADRNAIEAKLAILKQRLDRIQRRT